MLKTHVKETSNIKRMMREGLARYGVETDEEIIHRARRSSIERHERMECLFRTELIPRIPKDFPPPPTFSTAPPAPPPPPVDVQDEPETLPTPPPAPKKRGWFGLW